MEKALEFLASSFEVSRHLEFYLIWTQKLLLSHGQKLKPRYAGLPCCSGDLSPGQLVRVVMGSFVPKSSMPWGLVLPQ